MHFKQTRLVTKDVARLTRFYEAVTGAHRVPGGDGYVEFRVPVDCLGIVGPAVEDAYGPGVVRPGANRSAVLDFEVEDVDREFVRLREIVTDWVLPPTNNPWGTRAMLFRDPDGNLINVFAPPNATRHVGKISRPPH